VSRSCRISTSLHRGPDGRWNNVTRLSASGELLDAAVAEIVAAGHDQVLLLGDVSDLGAHEVISAALQRIIDPGLRLWVVPGNHDVRSSPDAFAGAVQGFAASVALREEHLGIPGGEVAMCGHGLRSDDSGRTCHATNLPDLAPVRSRLLLWASHYPVVSQQPRLRAGGLRYPGDLVNLDDVRQSMDRYHGPVLVLHGHLHTAVVGQAGPVLQIGVPAVVEWPHAWTDTSIEFTGNTVLVRTALTPIPGAWSSRDVNTVLDEREQNWVFAARRWKRVPEDDL
jgi:3',5'-cyclic AMP phosphodiesterase CpdA